MKFTKSFLKNNFLPGVLVATFFALLFLAAPARENKVNAQQTVPNCSVTFQYTLGSGPLASSGGNTASPDDPYKIYGYIGSIGCNRPEKFENLNVYAIAGYAGASVVYNADENGQPGSLRGDGSFYGGVLYPSLPYGATDSSQASMMRSLIDSCGQWWNDSVFRSGYLEFSSDVPNSAFMKFFNLGTFSCDPAKSANGIPSDFLRKPKNYYGNYGIVVRSFLSGNYICGDGGPDDVRMPFGISADTEFCVPPVIADDSGVASYYYDSGCQNSSTSNNHYTFANTNFSDSCGDETPPTVDFTSTGTNGGAGETTSCSNPPSVIGLNVVNYEGQNPPVVGSDESLALSYSSENAESCGVVGFDGGDNPTTGNVVVGSVPLGQTAAEYTLVCNPPANSGCGSTKSSIGVSVNPATITPKPRNLRIIPIVSCVDTSLPSLNVAALYWDPPVTSRTIVGYTLSVNDIPIINPNTSFCPPDPFNGPCATFPALTNSYVILSSQVRPGVAYTFNVTAVYEDFISSDPAYVSSVMPRYCGDSTSCRITLSAMPSVLDYGSGTSNLLWSVQGNASYCTLNDDLAILGPNDNYPYSVGPFTADTPENLSCFDITALPCDDKGVVIGVRPAKPDVTPQSGLCSTGEIKLNLQSSELSDSYKLYITDKDQYGSVTGTRAVSNLTSYKYSDKGAGGTGLLPGTYHTYQVVGVNKYGESPKSSAKTVVAPEVCNVGPVSCFADPSTSVAPASITWKAGAPTGGDGAYTYDWRDTTTNALLGTGATFTKSYSAAGRYDMKLEVVSGGKTSSGNCYTIVSPAVVVTPTVDLKAALSGYTNYLSSLSVNSGQQFNLKWTTGGSPTSCMASVTPTAGSFSGSKNVSGGTETKGPLGPNTYAYTLVCSNSAGNATSNATVTVKPQLFVSRFGTGTGSVLSAEFAPKIDCGLSCSNEFNMGDVVTLTPYPDANSDFAGWLGCSSVGNGSKPACVINMNGDKLVAATFNLKQPSALQPPVLSPATPLCSEAPSGSIKVTWPTVAGATSYKIYRSSSYGGPWTNVYEGNNTSFVESGNLTPSARYHYKAQSSSGSSLSTFSDPYSALASDCRLPNTPKIDLKFNNSDGPYQLTSCGESGTISWVVSDSTSCVASGKDTFNRTLLPAEYTPGTHTQSSGPFTAPSHTLLLQCSNQGVQASDSVVINNITTTPDFAVAATPPSVSMRYLAGTVPGGVKSSSTLVKVSIDSCAQFSNNVSLSASPNTLGGVQVKYNFGKNLLRPNEFQTGTSLTVEPTSAEHPIPKSDTPYIVTIAGTGGGITRTANLNLYVGQVVPKYEER